MPPSPRRGEIWRVKFDPTQGAELRKTRPAVVISSDEIGILPIKLVAPITGWKEAFETNLWHVRIDPDDENGLDKPSAVDALQIRSVAIERFVERVGMVPSETLSEVTAAVAAVIEHE